MCLRENRRTGNGESDRDNSFNKCSCKEKEGNVIVVGKKSEVKKIFCF